jgi:hypothetical protein
MLIPLLGEAYGPLNFGGPFPFYSRTSSETLSLPKGEILELLNPADNQVWFVKRSDGTIAGEI